ncbi:hypothetical protein KEJ31_07225 [Candidatus Bathyarchaeota archaeon]|nr:hypothetical protein [Candidatus Bathyarchaeota archaeon]
MITKIDEKIVNLARAFNLLEDLTRADDVLPSRFLEAPIPEGSAKGETINLKYIVDRYYE